MSKECCSEIVSFLEGVEVLSKEGLVDLDDSDILEKTKNILGRHGFVCPVPENTPAGAWTVEYKVDIALPRSQKPSKSVAILDKDKVWVEPHTRTNPSGKKIHVEGFFRPARHKTQQNTKRKGKGYGTQKRATNNVWVVLDLIQKRTAAGSSLSSAQLKKMLPKTHPAGRWGQAPYFSYIDTILKTLVKREEIYDSGAGEYKAAFKKA